MLPTFVIGLREGVEASLIIGIIATFLRKEGRSDALRAVWIGVGAACALCVAVAVALRAAEQQLPQRQQEELETVISILAVIMVTYMIVWMKRNARGLRSELETRAGTALADGSTRTLVIMAFLAVLREGFETAVFFLAALQSSSNARSSSIGATLGILVAIAIGYGIYRGGVNLNMKYFFRVTGVVLILVAGGLVATAFHTAHEAGWSNILLGQAADLSWLIRPGSVQSALATGMLGIQPQPAVIEVLGWLLYVIPATLIILWPTHSRPRPTQQPAVST